MLRNTASQTIGAQMLTAADGSAFTGEVTVYITGDGGTQAAGSVGSDPGLCVHEGNGYHSYAPAQAETDYAHIAFTFVGTGAAPATVQLYTKAGDAFTRLGAPAGASVSADIAAVKAETASLQTDTNDIQARLPAALVSGRMDSSVGAMATNVLTATAINADAFTAAKFAADVTTEFQAGLATASAISTMQGNVTDILADTTVIGAPAGASISADIAAVKVDTADIRVTTDKLDNTLENTSDGYIFTVNGLQNGPSGSGASPSAIADEVQTRTIAAVTLVNGLAANVITAAATAADFTTEIQAGLATAAALATVDTVVDAILADTGTDGVVVATASKTGYQLSATGVDDILDEAVDGAVTLRQSVRLANSALGGKASGLETTEATFRDLADTKDRIVATVDADGNRTAITRDLT